MCGRLLNDRGKSYYKENVLMHEVMNVIVLTATATCIHIGRQQEDKITAQEHSVDDIQSAFLLMQSMHHQQGGVWKSTLK